MVVATIGRILLLPAVGCLGVFFAKSATHNAVPEDNWLMIGGIVLGAIAIVMMTRGFTPTPPAKPC